MSTIKDVAKLAKVSIATVSRVVNNSTKVSDGTRIHVQKAMLTLDYYPDANARALSQKTTNTIGIVVADVSDPFFGAMVSAVDQVALETGNFLLIGNGYHDEQKERNAILKLIEHRCSSLVVHSKMLKDEELTKLMQQVPGMVLINRILPDFEHCCITIDDHYGSIIAIRHLIQNGHRNIGYLCSNHPISDSYDRLQGYKDGLLEQSIDFKNDNVVYASPDELGGEQAMIELLNRNSQITAIACYNDSMAAGAMSALYDKGIKVPHDMSVIGFDDMPISHYLYPKLTTIHYPVRLMSQQAAELALTLAKGYGIPDNTTNVFTPTLTKRFSVKNLNPM